MGATFTTGKETAVGAREVLKDPAAAFGGSPPEDKFSGLYGKPVAEVTFPNEALDPVTIYKPYPTYDEAKAAAKAVADEFNRLAPRGFPMLRGAYRDTDKAARQRVEAFARTWAGDDAVVSEVID